jgi:hypothetical protein
MHDRGGPAAGSGRGLEKMESKNKFNPYTLLFLTRSACLTVETTQLRFRLIPELENTVMLISTPDFSEYFDNAGQSWPRDRNKRREVFQATVAQKVRKVHVVGAALAVVLGLVIAVTRTQDYLEAKDMLAHGIATDASLVQTQHWIEDAPSRRQFVHDVLVYEFTAASGTQHRNQVDYTPITYSPVKQGDAVRILYNEQQPGMNQLRAHDERFASLQDSVQVVLVAIGSLFGSACFIGFLLRRKITAQLPQHFL